MDKHSSLLRKFPTYDIKSFITLAHDSDETPIKSVQAPEAVFLVVCDPTMNKL
jgi:hypothetical protein